MYGKEVGLLGMSPGVGCNFVFHPDYVDQKKYDVVVSPGENQKFSALSWGDFKEVESLKKAVLTASTVKTSKIAQP